MFHHYLTDHGAKQSTAHYDTAKKQPMIVVAVDTRAARLPASPYDAVDLINSNHQQSHNIGTHCIYARALHV